VSRRIRTAAKIQVFRDGGVRKLVVLAEESPDAFGRGVGVTHRIDLGAVASREDDHFTADALRRERSQRDVESAAGKVDALPQIDGRRTMAQTDCE
jgi:hypothetical protein